MWTDISDSTHLVNIFIHANAKKMPAWKLCEEFKLHLWKMAAQHTYLYVKEVYLTWNDFWINLGSYI